MRTPGPARLAIRGDPARRRQEASRHVLCVDPALDRVPAQDDVLLREGQGLTRRDEHLLAHEVDARDHLRDRVLDLDPRVHLHEEVLAVRCEQALDRPGRPVAGGTRRVDGERADTAPELAVDPGRGRLLDELLVPTLDRAVALAEVDDVAVGVREHLHLDVARIDEVALGVHGRVAEVAETLPSRRLERALGVLGRAHDAHPLAAAAGRRLDDERVADLLRQPQKLTCVGERLRSRPGRRALRRLAWRRAHAVLLPISSIASGGGPIHERPAASTARANAAFSARKP